MIAFVHPNLILKCFKYTTRCSYNLTPVEEVNKNWKYENIIKRSISFDVKSMGC